MISAEEEGEVPVLVKLQPEPSEWSPVQKIKRFHQAKLIVITSPHSISVVHRK